LRAALQAALNGCAAPGDRPLGMLLSELFRGDTGVGKDRDARGEAASAQDEDTRLLQGKRCSGLLSCLPDGTASEAQTRSALERRLLLLGQKTSRSADLTIPYRRRRDGAK
jgi:hypothetical protein